MRLKLPLAALLAMAFLPVAVGTAEAETHWTINGTTLTGSESVAISNGPWTQTGTALGTTIEMTASSIQCSGICKIFGSGRSSGSLLFTNFKVVKPAHCTAGNPGSMPGTVASEPLEDQIIMDPSSQTGPVFDKFLPASGTAFMAIEYSGSLCVLDGLVLTVTGTAAGESSRTTGVEAVSQSFTFGSSQQTTGGGALAFSGGGSFILSGTLTMALSGTHSGQPFGDSN